MAKLFLFCDESGTMPVRDRDGPFCAATIATTGRPPTLTKRSGHIGALAKAFSDLKCVPYVVFVRPRTGYGDMLSRKTSKMNTMARATRLMTGTNAYFPDYGHNMGNMVWIRCMALSLVNAVLRTGTPEAIRAVCVILDSKSMAEPSRQLFVDRVRSMAEDMSVPRAEVELGNRSSVNLREQIRFRREDVSVSWSDEAPSPEFKDGLFLAHRLSGLAKAALESVKEAKLAQDLSTLPKDLFYDATPDVVRPLSRAAVQRWKNRTGLPEPFE